MQRISRVIIKEFRQVLRDKPMLAIIFLVPVVQLFLLSFAITTEVKHIKLLIADLDRSTVSRHIVQTFEHTDRFHIVGYSTDLGEIRQKMRSWQVQLALVIPPDFERRLQRNLKPQLELVLDGVDGNTAEVSLGYATGMLAQFGLTYVIEHGMAGGPSRRILPATAQERMWYNPDLSTQQFMIPAIVVVLLTILPMMLSALSLVKEKEIGTLEQLMVTPLKRQELLAGKLIPFLILTYFELSVVMTVAILFFRIPMNGSYLLLAFLTMLYIFTTLGLGIFISTIGRSQQQAMFMAWFFMVFMIMLGGFFIPIENMPPVLQKLTYINPMRYSMRIVRDIFQKGSSIRFLAKDVIPMGVFGLLIFTFSVIKFQKRIK